PEKKELRGLRTVEAQLRQPAVAAPETPAPVAAASAVVADTVLALRQTVREHGTLPFDIAGLRVVATLDELGQTLDRCLEKGGSAPATPAHADPAGVGSVPGAGSRHTRRTSPPAGACPRLGAAARRRRGGAGAGRS